MTTFARPERLEFNVYLTKQSKAVRVGITFESDEDAAASGRQARPRVKSLAPYGLASTNGLQIGDEIININGQRVTTPLAAASMLRELSGDMRIGVRRPHPVHPREAAGAAGSSAQAAAGLPKLSLGAVTSQEPEERDLGELSARAIKGVADFFSSIGDDLSRMLQPKVRRRRRTAPSTPPHARARAVRPSRPPPSLTPSDPVFAAAATHRRLDDRRPLARLPQSAAAGAMAMGSDGAREAAARHRGAPRAAPRRSHASHAPTRAPLGMTRRDPFRRQAIPPPPGCSARPPPTIEPPPSLRHLGRCVRRRCGSTRRRSSSRAPRAATSIGCGRRCCEISSRGARR